MIALLAACTPPAPPPPVPANAPAANNQPGTGLRPPTAEERARLDALAPRNPPLAPNELARERLNRERQEKGLPPLPANQPAPAPEPAPK